MYFPGPGDVQFVLPPGSLEVDLLKAPSGHLVIPIDVFEKVFPKQGGVPDLTLQLHSHSRLDSRLGASAEDASEPPLPDCSVSPDTRRVQYLV